MTEEKRWLRRLGKGDREALGWIYQRYKDELLTVGVCLTGDRASAEDCLQDVFVGLAAGARKVQVRGSLKGYLAASVANRARDRLRQRGRRQEVNLEAAMDCPGGEVVPEEGLMERERKERLAGSLAELPWEQREAVVLHLQAEMTFRQIAAKQEVSIPTAQSRYRYGLEKLRNLLSLGKGVEL